MLPDIEVGGGGPTGPDAGVGLWREAPETGGCTSGGGPDCGAALTEGGMFDP